MAAVEVEESREYVLYVYCIYNLDDTFVECGILQTVLCQTVLYLVCRIGQMDHLNYKYNTRLLCMQYIFTYTGVLKEVNSC